MVRWYCLHRGALPFSSGVITSGLKVVFRSGVGSRYALHGSISSHEAMKNRHRFTGNPQDRTLLHYVSLPWLCDMICEVWTPEFCLITSLDISSSWEVELESSCFISMKIYPVFLWDDQPLALLRAWECPVLTESRSWAYPSELGSEPSLRGFKCYLAKVFRTALNWFGLCWFVYKTRGSVMLSAWSATLWRNSGFVLRYKRHLLNSGKWF